jgi:trehalose 6-phosphate synthase/phosphatase
MLQAVVRRAQAASRVVILLDYDGTLVPFAATPDLAMADRELLELLARLVAHPRFEVHVVSGRARETLDRWLGALRLSLHAEHGAWSRAEGTRVWKAFDVPPLAWRAPALAVLEDFAARTPGAFVEEKSFGVAWHYRLADPCDGASRASELRRHLTMLLANEPVEVLSGQKVIEVRPGVFHKGRVAETLGQHAEEGWLIVAIGDDRTDEDLFASLPSSAVAIHVGPTPSCADIRVRDVAAVRRFLESLVTE